jgi:hypothetical protein
MLFYDPVVLAVCGKKGTDTFSATASVWFSATPGGGKGCLSPFFRKLLD